MHDFFKSITKVEDRKKVLSERRLCFHCIRVKHRVAECRSKRNCQTCKGKRYSSNWGQSNTLKKYTIATKGVFTKEYEKYHLLIQNTKQC